MPSLPFGFFNSTLLNTIRKVSRTTQNKQSQFAYNNLEKRQLLAAIAWSSSDITQNADVSTNGDLVFAINASDSTGSTTVNGVEFVTSNRANAGVVAQAQSIGDESISTSFTNENTRAFEDGGLGVNGSVGGLIEGAWWGTPTGDQSVSVTLTGLEVGTTYELQIFANDARSSRDDGWVSSLSNGVGGFGVNLELNNQPFGGRAGDFGIGTFTADSTSQSFEISGSIDGQVSTSRAHVNAIQLRTLSGTDLSPGADLLPGAVPLINEFSASNSSIIDDDNGNSSDWIEIYNAGEEPIDLEGYSLTDDATNATKYVFPSTVVEGGEYLIVFAGDDADPTTGDDLYTGFGLSRGGEYLGFFDPAGSLVSEFGENGADYPPQFTDISYGLEQATGAGPSTVSDLGTFSTATTITVDTVGSEFDTELALFDVRGTLLTQNDDTFGLQSQLIQQDLADGTYFIAVGGFSSFFADGFVADSGASSGNFTLNLNETTFTSEIASNQINFFSFNIGAATEPGVSFFATPTPGSANVDPVQGVIDEVPTVSVERGFKEQAFSTVVTSNTPGATLVYTTDGTEPSLSNGTRVFPVDSNALAQANIFISQTTSLRTSAFRAGFLTTAATTHSYVFLDDVLTSDVLNYPQALEPFTNQQLKDALLDLPTLSFNFDNDIVDSQTPEQRASIEWLAPDGSDGFQLDAGIVAFGGNSTTFEKKNFRLHFRGEYGASELEFPLFEGFDDGVTPATETFDQLEFRSGSHDRGMRGFGLSNRFVDETLLDAGHNVPHGRFVHIYINGEYWGQYHMRERWNDDFLASYYGGEEESYEAINGNVNNGNSTPNGWDPGTVFDGSGAAWDNINNIVANNNLSPTQRFAALRQTVDLEQYVDYMLVWMAGQAENEYRSGGSTSGSVPYTFYLNDADGWLRDPVDGSGGQGGDKTGNAGPANILGRLVSEADPEFMTFYADRIQRMFLNDGPLSVGQSTARLQELIDQVELSVILESARWSFSGEPGGGSLLVSQFQDRSQDALDRVLPNIIERDNNIIERFRSQGVFPNFDAPESLIDGAIQNDGTIVSGAELTFAANDLVFFTVDGSDPRLPGGGISPNAIAYDAGSIIETTTLFGRGSSWRFNDTGANLGTAWQANSFNDTGAGWSEDTGDFGFGDGQATQIANNNQITTYFRKTFNFSPENFDTATFSFKRDDGAVVYLNGEEIFRNNLPTGNILSSTTATAGVGGEDETNFLSFEFDSNLLRDGDNTFAVEIHQRSATSSDVTFDAELLLNRQVMGTSSEPFVLNSSAVVQSRTFSGGNWSALSSAALLIPVSQADLRISELHFNPADPSSAEIAAGFIDNDDFEFLEIFNPSPTGTINLEGVQLSDGVTFDFGNVDLLPGERVVVVEDVDAFMERYGDSATVLGQWSGALSNSGERVTLIDSSSDEIMSVDYQDNDPWHIAADGRGFSLVLEDPVNTPVEELGKYFSWRASTLLGGTPGEASVDRSGVVVNEILANSDSPQSDTIELFNPTSSAIDVGGWYLSDEGDDLLKFQIPIGTQIAAGGYLVFDESDFNVTSTGFALSSSEGDQVYLSQAAGGVLVGLQDTVEFDATFDGESLGRLPEGSGRLTRLADTSFGTTNGDAEVGPLVISEVNYHPSSPSAAALAIDPTLIDNDLEFIEIANPTSAAFDLTNWRIRGEADFDFAQGTSLPAGETIVVASFDPALEPVKLAAFQAHYGINSNVTIVGALSASLSNSTGRIALQQPDAPNASGLIPNVVVDEVVYDDLAPWPDADGTGQSLVRDNLEANGNVSTSWTAVLPTPGSLETEFLLGDANLDGVVNFLDIGPFVTVIQTGLFLDQADVNRDGEINFLDIGPFVSILTS